MAAFHVIDAHYLQPEFAAVYLYSCEGKFGIVDTGTNATLKHLEEEIARLDLSWSDLEWIALTHIHLDHSGAASEIVRRSSDKVKILCHPRAKRHLADPTRLIAGVQKVYGESEFETLYGRIHPISENQIEVMDDESLFEWNDLRLRFLSTRGHANHHNCIYDECEGRLFTGDSFGLHYPFLQKHGCVAIPSTSPSDFDAVEALKSIDRIIFLRPNSVFPTHFGKVKDIAQAASELKALIFLSQGLISRAKKEGLSSEERGCWLEVEYRLALDQHFKRRGITLSIEDWRLLKLDVELNAAGLCAVM